MERHDIVTGVPVAVKTTLLSGSRVRLQVQVPPDELEGRVERKAHQLGRELKLPGFRRGKVPAPLVIQRIGRDAVLEEAVRDTLSSWYSDAIETSGIVPVGDPQVDLGDLPPEGEALEFSIEIGVLPKAELGDYEGLEVARGEPKVEEEQIQHEIDSMRERLARLETAERPAAKGDFVVVDYVGSFAAADSPEDAPRPQPLPRRLGFDGHINPSPPVGGRGRGPARVSLRPTDLIRGDGRVRRAAPRTGTSAPLTLPSPPGRRGERVKICMRLRFITQATTAPPARRCGCRGSSAARS